MAAPLRWRWPTGSWAFVEAYGEAQPVPVSAQSNPLRDSSSRERRAWSRWIGSGAWGPYFDNPAGGGPDLEFADWQVIDRAGAVEHPDLCDGALSYLLERMRLQVEDPTEAARLKLMAVDEAWRYLQDPAVHNYLAEAAKTWRKKNTTLTLATQSTVEEQWPRSLRLLSTELANAAFARDVSEVAAMAAGTAETELQVEQVVLRIHPAPEAPHGATADFDLVHLRAGQETLRERWSLTLRFDFLARVPAELVVYNPMGILVTYLQADRALVTEQPR